MSDDKPKLAGEIRVRRGGLSIDGEEFPWFIAIGGLTVDVRRDEMPSVTVTLLAERVVVDNDARRGTD